MNTSAAPKTPTTPAKEIKMEIAALKENIDKTNQLLSDGFAKLCGFMEQAVVVKKAQEESAEGTGNLATITLPQLQLL
jgi:hypothetical protein